jgi:hypothetical protein
MLIGSFITVASLKIIYHTYTRSVLVCNMLEAMYRIG